MQTSPIAFYDRNATSYFQQTSVLKPNPLTDVFLGHLPTTARILDAGCGSGRDSLYFKNLGHAVTAIDASSELAKLASEHIGQPVGVMRFEDMAHREEFDGVWASASLVHHAPEDMAIALQKFADALVTGGTLFFSVKYGQGETVDGDRRFPLYDEASIRSVLAQVPNLEIVKMWGADAAQMNADVLKRAQVTWLSALLRKKN